MNLALNRKKKFLSVYLEETDLPPGLELRMGDLQSIPKFRMPDATYRKKVFTGLENLLGADGRDVPEGEDPAEEEEPDPRSVIFDRFSCGCRRGRASRGGGEG